MVTKVKVHPGLPLETHGRPQNRGYKLKKKYHNATLQKWSNICCLSIMKYNKNKWFELHQFCAIIIYCWKMVDSGSFCFFLPAHKNLQMAVMVQKMSSPTICLKFVHSFTLFFGSSNRKNWVNFESRTYLSYNSSFFDDGIWRQGEEIEELRRMQFFCLCREVFLEHPLKKL